MSTDANSKVNHEGSADAPSAQASASQPALPGEKGAKAGSGPMNGVLVVKEKRYLTPHFIRVVFHSDEVERFAGATLGVNNKIFIPPAGVDEIHFPGVVNGRWVMPEERVRPIIRTYTHRAIDIARREMVIDFVAHGEAGPASRWAIHASPGDRLGVAMKQGAPLYPPADWYLLVGDATAIPVLSVILESLPEGARGLALIEVHGPEDEQVIETRSAVELRFVHNPEPEAGSQLFELTKQALADAGRSAGTTVQGEGGAHFAYIAAEYRTVKALRSYLRGELGWGKQDFYAFSYWKANAAEDESGDERRAESLNEAFG